MRVLVTGATGVVGRRLVPLLGAAGHHVTAVVRTEVGRIQLERQGVCAIDLDLFDPREVLRAVVGHEVVVNLATHIPHSSARMLLPGAWRENDRLRHIASNTLVDASIAANASRFIQESFAPVYPDSGDRWIDEAIPIEPVRTNRTIVDAEAATERFTRSGRIGVVLRFGAFYGPDASQTLEMIDWVLRGRAPLPGAPDAYISSVSHDDAATAVASALAIRAGIYNVVDDEPVTHRTYFDSMADALRVARPKLPPRWATFLFGSLGELVARSLRISNRKLRMSTDWMPKYPSVRQGWPDLVAHLQAAKAKAGHRPIHDEHPLH